MYDPFGGAFGGAGGVEMVLIVVDELLIAVMAPFCFFIGLVVTVLVFTSLPFDRLSNASSALRLTPWLTGVAAVVGPAPVVSFGRSDVRGRGATGFASPKEVIISLKALMLYDNVEIKTSPSRDETKFTSRGWYGV